MGPLTMELAALEHLKKWCLHVFSVAIDLILFKLASYKDGISGRLVFEKYSKEL